ncbi:hypothetical protein CK203_068461 [Vitis vinifera]|uniref:DUF4283 domain-containing protein n=1 Tax=Vitis vinifera TaxID=29760 RepID=A0A438F336_VITVI|nr:hypothetical protein CK203_068461 [Vitis vinifera]
MWQEEGKGQSLGWSSLAERLRGFRVAPSGGLQVPKGSEVLLREKEGSKVQRREKGGELKSYAEAVKTSSGRVGGQFEYVRSWATQHWALRGNLRIDRLGRGFLLFEFESSSEAERVLARGLRNIKENVIILDKWNLEWGVIVKILVPKKFGCGGFVAADEKLLYTPELQWAQILVKCVDKEFPSTAHIVVGSGCYSLQLWWESSPWFMQVVSAGGFGGEDGSRKGEDDGGTSHALHYGSQKEKVEQVRLQQGVLDVSSSGGVPSFFHVVAFDAGTVAEGR